MYPRKWAMILMFCWPRALSHCIGIRGSINKQGSFWAIQDFSQGMFLDIFFLIGYNFSGFLIFYINYNRYWIQFWWNIYHRLSFNKAKEFPTGSGFAVSFADSYMFFTLRDPPPGFVGLTIFVCRQSKKWKCLENYKTCFLSCNSKSFTQCRHIWKYFWE